jgi:hypothetical protein
VYNAFGVEILKPERHIQNLKLKGSIIDLSVKIQGLTRERRNSMSYVGAFFKNAPMCPFSIHGDTKQSMLWEVYRP